MARFAILTTLGVALFAGEASGHVGRGPAVVVIVNAANPVAALAHDQVSKIFLRRIMWWPNGDEILPVDQIERAPARPVFVASIHRKSPEAIRSYWQQQMFSGNQQPPPERVNDAEVLTYVRSNAGAIGYVAGDTDLGNGVKAIRLLP
jgi:ABC-type phosphate transport system substrate-binding protein